MNIMKLQNGTEIPVPGYGTWQTPDGEIAVNGVKKALECGFRHIDTAAIYRNEESVGRAVKESGIPREEIFITSKVWNRARGYESTLKAFEKSLNKLGMDYMDLYLIHWPASYNLFEDWEQINIDTWRAMTDLYKDGKIRAIGVSNFKPHHLRALMDQEVVPMVDQIEYHPGFMQEETVAFCRENDILVEAWSPLGTGVMLGNETLGSIAAKYNKSTAQLCIRWCMQHDVLPLPKSVTASRIEENLNVFDFEIDDDDMKTIDAMEYFGGSGLDPDEVDF
ncbi:MAG: aldo/keto reductase [Lachnospiraceae bacterium]|nr:aldo/keto reductase [Lachnospiraceae bacterium]